jgi:MYXO-CTERM domain-containing protein
VVISNTGGLGSGAVTSTGSTGTGSTGTGGGRRPASDKGCGCRVGDRSGSSLAWLAALLAVGLGVRRRRARAASN